MASIIQIKHGSGSNEPTSLKQAELALNVDTGQLWYGSGSAGNEVTQSKFKFKEVITDTLTAQQYVVSSSVTFVTTSFSDGSTIFGDEPEDTHKFTGSVDITGSINALNITASSSTGSFTGSFLGSFTSADIVALKLESASLLSYTASNNAEIVALKTTTASLIAEDTALKTKTASLDASIVSLKLETASLHGFTGSGFKSPDSMSIGTTLSNTTNIAGNVLYVHGNASASGEIEGNRLTAINVSGSDLLSSLTASFGTSPSVTTNVANTPLYVHGNISSSGTIISRIGSVASTLQVGTALSSLTASIGTSASNTTNPSGIPLYVHGHISASGAIVGSTLTGELTTAAQGNVTTLGALEGLTAGGAIDFTSADEVSIGDAIATSIASTKSTITSASIGTSISNTTNIAGTPLYVHGNASASGEIEGASLTSAIISGSNKLNALTASFGTVVSTTTNPSGISLYVHGAISASNNLTGRNVNAGATLTSSIVSASNKLMGLTASFGTATSNTTNVAGTPLYVHGNVSASGTFVGSNTIKLANTKRFQGATLDTTNVGNWLYSDNESENKDDHYDNDAGYSSITSGVSTLSVNISARSGKYLVPTATQATKWTGVATHTNAKDITVGLWKVTPVDNNNSALAIHEITGEVTLEGKGNTKMRTFSVDIHVDSGSLVQGEIIIPLLKRESGTSSGAGFFQSTLLFYTEV